MKIIEFNRTNAALLREELQSNVAINQVVIDGVLSDLVDGGSATVDINNGPSGNRSFIVSGIDGPPEAAMWSALQAAGIPRIGDPHPAMALLPVSNVRADPIDGFTDAAKVIVTYGITDSGPGNNPDDPEAAPTIEVSTTLQTVKFNVDRNGKVVDLWFLLPIDGGKVLTDNGQPLIDPVTGKPLIEEATEWISDRQVATLERQVPMSVVTFKRRENASPGLIASRFVGHVNSSGIFGDSSRTWLCAELSGSSNDGGLTYDVTYQFQRAADMTTPTDQLMLDLFRRQAPGKVVLGWDVIARYVKKDGSVPDPGEMFWGPIGSSIKLVEVYPEADFRDIPGLPFGLRVTQIGPGGISPRP